MQSCKILSYNIGHLYLLQPRRHLPIRGINNVFFDPKDIDRIKHIVQENSPDIIFFQELTSVQDAKCLAQQLGFAYFSFCQGSHLAHIDLGTGILYNDPSATISMDDGPLALHSVCIDGFLYTNVHLNPFSKRKRAHQIQHLLSYLSKYPDHHHIVAGDFNFKRWKGRWQNATDKRSYALLTKQLRDTAPRAQVTHVLGYCFDYAFVSPGVDVDQYTCIQKRHKAIDHYPIVLHRAT